MSLYVHTARFHYSSRTLSRRFHRETRKRVERRRDTAAVQERVPACSGTERIPEIRASGVTTGGAAADTTSPVQFRCTRLERCSRGLSRELAKACCSLPGDGFSGSSTWSIVHYTLPLHYRMLNDTYTIPWP